MTSYAWVSFATDEDGPLGVVFTALRPGEGDDRLGAMLFVNRLHRQGVNPGGEVQWATAPEERWASQPGWDWLSQNADRLIPPVELVEVGYLQLSDFGPVGRAQIEAQLAERHGVPEVGDGP